MLRLGLLVVLVLAVAVEAQTPEGYIDTSGGGVDNSTCGLEDTSPCATFDQLLINMENSAAWASNVDRPVFVMGSSLTLQSPIFPPVNSALKIQPFDSTATLPILCTNLTDSRVIVMTQDFDTLTGPTSLTRFLIEQTGGCEPIDSPDGGMIVLNATTSKLQLIDMVLRNYDLSSSGGRSLVEISNSGSGTQTLIVLQNVTCHDVGHNSVDGPCLYAEDALLVVVRDSTFLNNDGRSGGAIYLSRAGLRLETTSFDSNVATNDGGAVYSYVSSIDSRAGVSWMDNDAATGGAIAVCNGLDGICSPGDSSKTTSLANNEFFRNGVTSTVGASVYLTGSNVIFDSDGSNFKGQTGVGVSSAIGAQVNGAALTITGGEHTALRANNAGAFLDVFNTPDNDLETSVTLTGLTVRSADNFANVAGSCGGAVRMLTDTASSLTIDDCMFQDVQAYAGGAICTRNIDLTVTDSEFNATRTRSAGEGDGGAILWDVTIIDPDPDVPFKLNVIRTEFLNTFAERNGGAIAVRLPTESALGGSVPLPTQLAYTIEECRFDGSFCDNDGGAIAVDSSQLGGEIVWCEFEGTYARDSSGLGGAVFYNKLTGTNLFSPLHFIRGERSGGAGETVFRGTYSGGDGGAIYAHNADVDVSGSRFIDTYATGDDGGAIYFRHDSGKIPPDYTPTLRVSTSAFVPTSQALVQTTLGGWIACANDHNLDLTDVTMVCPYTNEPGACVWWGNGDVTIDGGRYDGSGLNNILTVAGTGDLRLLSAEFVNGFTDSTSRGGCVTIAHTSGEKDAFVEGTHFVGCSAVSGGAIHTRGNLNMAVEPRVSDSRRSIFRDCSATSNGGAFFTDSAHGGECMFANTDFENNTAGADGGSIFWDGIAATRTLTLRSVNVIDSFAGSDGGFLYLTDGGLTVEQDGARNQFINTRAEAGSGGAVYALNVDNPNFVDGSESYFSNTYAALEGGGVWMQVDSGSNVYNVAGLVADGSFALNRGGFLFLRADLAGVGGAVCDIKDCTIQNSEVTFEDATKRGGAIYIDASAYEVSFSGVDVSRCRAGTGSAIVVEDADAVTFRDVVLRENHAWATAALYLDPAFSGAPISWTGENIVEDNTAIGVGTGGTAGIDFVDGTWQGVADTLTIRRNSVFQGLSPGGLRCGSGKSLAKTNLVLSDNYSPNIDVANTNCGNVVCGECGIPALCDETDATTECQCAGVVTGAQCDEVPAGGDACAALTDAGCSACLSSSAGCGWCLNADGGAECMSGDDSGPLLRACVAFDPAEVPYVRDESFCPEVPPEVDDDDEGEDDGEGLGGAAVAVISVVAVVGLVGGALFFVKRRADGSEPERVPLKKSPPVAAKGKGKGKGKKRDSGTGSSGEESGDEGKQRGSGGAVSPVSGNSSPTKRLSVGGGGGAAGGAAGVTGGSKRDSGGAAVAGSKRDSGGADGSGRRDSGSKAPVDPPASLVATVAPPPKTDLAMVVVGIGGGAAGGVGATNPTPTTGGTGAEPVAESRRSVGRKVSGADRGESPSRRASQSRRKGGGGDAAGADGEGGKEEGDEAGGTGGKKKSGRRPSTGRKIVVRRVSKGRRPSATGAAGEGPRRGPRRAADSPTKEKAGGGGAGSSPVRKASPGRKKKA